MPFDIYWSDVSNAQIKQSATHSYAIDKPAKFCERAGSLEHTMSGTEMMTAQNGDAFFFVQEGIRRRGQRTEE